MSNFRPEKYPKIIHIGTQKAGSTYLYNLLLGHPDLTLSRETEVNFFSDKYDLGVEWYLGTFPDGPNKIDISPTYFKGGRVIAERIKDTFPEPKKLKFLIFLRNPIDYLVSHFTMHHMIGYFKNSPKLYPDPPKNIIDFLQKFPKYPNRAKYYKLLIKEWFTVFDKSQFKVILFENFISREEETLGQIFQFLGVRDVKLETKPISQNRRLRYRFLYYLRGKIAKRSYLKKILKKNLTINSLVSKYLTAKSSDKLTPDQRSQIKNLLTADVEKLKNELGLDLSLWSDFKN